MPWYELAGRRNHKTTAQQRGSLVYELGEMIWHDRGDPGAYDVGLIQPSLIELERYDAARYEARELAGHIVELFEEHGWTPPKR